MIETRQLEYFLAAVDAGGFKLAGIKFGHSQSAISQQISLLEEKLGRKLFIRTPRRTYLTEAGEELVPLARKVMQMNEVCEERMKNLDGELKGTLNIGVGSFIEPYLRKAAYIFMERHPKVKLNVTFSQAKHLNKLLRNREIDIAFTMNTAYDTENIISTPCLKFSIKAIMSKNHPLASKEYVTIEDVKQYKVILPDAGKRAMETVQKFLNWDVNQLDVQVVLNSAEAALRMTEMTNMITFLPELCVEPFDNLVVKEMYDVDDDFVSNVHWLKDICLRRSAEEFVRIVKDVCPSIESPEDNDDFLIDS